MSSYEPPAPLSVPPSGAAELAEGPKPVDLETPARPGSGRRRRSGLLLLALVLLAGAIVIAAFYSLGLLSPRHSPGIGPLSFGQARNLSDTFAGAEPGGPWVLDQGLGLDLSMPTTLTALTYPCFANDGGSNYAPADPGNRGDGLSPMWLLSYYNTSDDYLVVSIENGTANLFGTYSAQRAEQCAVTWGNPDPLGTLSQDSPSAAASAAANGARAFLQGHPSASVEMLVGTGFFRATTSWEMLDTICPSGWFPAWGGEPELRLLLNASNSRVLFSQNSSQVCYGPEPQPGSIALDGPLQALPGQEGVCPLNGTRYFAQCFAFIGVRDVNDTSKFGLSLETFDGTVLPPTTAPAAGAGLPTGPPSQGWYAMLLNDTGTSTAPGFEVLATYPSSSGSWNTPSGVPVNLATAGDDSNGTSLIIVTATDLTGSNDLLFASGVGDHQVVINSGDDLF